MPADGRLSGEEEEKLLDDLLAALDRVVHQSGCADMVPLWMVATRRLREEWLQAEKEPTPPIPDRIRNLGKSVRSKYGALAAWRHAVLLTDVLAELEPRPRRAVEALYFEPFEANEPPYAWSRASSRCPQASAWSSASTLDTQARKGCAQSVRLLEELAGKMQAGSSLLEEARADFVRVGARDGTLRDVLRYEDLRPTEEE